MAQYLIIFFEFLSLTKFSYNFLHKKTKNKHKTKKGMKSQIKSIYIIIIFLLCSYTLPNVQSPKISTESCVINGRLLFNELTLKIINEFNARPLNKSHYIEELKLKNNLNYFKHFQKNFLVENGKIDDKSTSLSLDKTLIDRTFLKGLETVIYNVNQIREKLYVNTESTWNEKYEKWGGEIKGFLLSN